MKMILALAALAAFSAASIAAAQERRIATWNIGAAERSADEVGRSASDFVDELGPVDVLILQEVIDEAQVRAVAEAVGLDHWVISDLSLPRPSPAAPSRRSSSQS